MFFSITLQVVKVITDNASNMKKAFEGKFCDWDTDCMTNDEDMIFTESFPQWLYEEAPPDNEDDVFLELDVDLFPFSANTSTGQLETPFRSSCLAHTLQLVIKDGQQALQVNFPFPMEVLLNLLLINGVFFETNRVT